MINNNILFTYFTNPLSQFEIRDFFNIKLSFLNNLQLSLTNIGLYLILAASFILIINLLSINSNKLIGNK
jgi:F-type H+-transporting ATPase subunit a